MFAIMTTEGAMNIVNVGRDFTPIPSGAEKMYEGDQSAQSFRERFLEAPLRRGESVFVEIDDTIGYSSLFLEEAFGGLIRSLRITPAQLRQQLHIVTESSIDLEEINFHIDEAGRLMEAAQVAGA
jgi:hypothetical protein